MPKLRKICSVVTPPNSMVMQNTGKPDSRSMITKNSRLSSDPSTIWALVSGVVSSTLNVSASFSWVIAPAVNTGASRHIMANCKYEMDSNTRVRLLARSLSELPALPVGSICMIKITNSRTSR